MYYSETSMKLLEYRKSYGFAIHKKCNDVKDETIFMLLFFFLCQRKKKVI